MLLHYDRGKSYFVPVIMLLCNMQFICYPLERGENLRSYLQEEAQAEKGNISYILKGNKECLCPWGHVGLEHNDSQCGPPETNCH